MVTLRHTRNSLELLYIAGCTRPDISRAVSTLSRFMIDPSTTHMACAKRVLRYLKGTKTLGIIYRHANNNPTRRSFTDDNGLGIEAFVDSDWASDTEDRHSQTGYIFTLAGGAPPNKTASHYRQPTQNTLLPQNVPSMPSGSIACYQRSMPSNQRP